MSLAKWTPLEEALASRFLGEKFPMDVLCFDSEGDILWHANKVIGKRTIRLFAKNINRLWIYPSPMSRIFAEIRERFPVHREMDCEQGQCEKRFVVRDGMDAVCPDCGTRYYSNASELSR